MKLEKKSKQSLFFLEIRFNLTSAKSLIMISTSQASGELKKLVREERSSGTNVTERAMECKDHGAGELLHLNPVLFSQMRWRQ